MKTKELDYVLPKELIAQNPPVERGDTRLLVFDRKIRKIIHKKYADIPSFIKKDDVVVLNKTKVVWARIFPKVQRTGKKVELLFLEKLKNDRWHCLIGRAKQVKEGDILIIGEFKINIELRESDDPGFIVKVKNADLIMKRYGHVPLPPYIKRKDKKNDEIRYNTIFAKNGLSVAAPTASLNLTDDLIEKIIKNGAKICYVNLDIGWGTFAPVNTEKIEDFKIHKEWIEVNDATVQLVNKCKGRIWAFGTTVVRTLETVATDRRKIKKYRGFSDLLIYPGYEFKVVEAIVTNFHAPQTSLIALVSAFAGKSNIKKLYADAIKNRYQFLSYGDSMLIT